MWLRLTKSDGQPVMVNMNAVVGFYPLTKTPGMKSKTTLVTTAPAGDSPYLMQVIEDFDEILERSGQLLSAQA